MRNLPVAAGSHAAADRIDAAYRLAVRLHGEARRSSQETYIDHGLFLAYGLAEIDLDDTDAICAAILHDALLPHTGMDAAGLSLEAGPQVVSIVEGVQALDKYANRASRGLAASELNLDTRGDRQTLEAIRRALLSLIEGDIRLILIRMVDALQDLRRAVHLQSALERKRLAYEAMHIYAPLANRLGIWHLKWQLEDEAFLYLEPDEYREIARHLDAVRSQRATWIAKAAARLQREIAAMGLTAAVSGRPKHKYSIYRKMKMKDLAVDEVYDIQALRVIIEPNDPEVYNQLGVKERDDLDRSLCYQVLGVVHNLWRPLPQEFDDYIAMPKANGYRSLHTAVRDPVSNQKLEVQIRTQRMHDEAERGIAAHWAYKEDDSTQLSASAQRRIQELRELVTTLQEAEESDDPTSLLDVDRLEDRIYVLTPNGDVIDLPAGSTPIDFAYHIHTDIGHRCRGARVNGKLVSLDYKLKSGDRIEIITAKRGGPSRDWMNPSLGYTGQARTRSKIRQWFRQQEREQNIAHGREVVERELRRLSLTGSFDAADIARQLKFDDEETFLAKLGFGDIQTVQITGALALMQQGKKTPDDELLPLVQPSRSGSKGLTVRGVEGLHTKMAGCCNPIAPEPIVGYITRGKGVTIHRRDCSQVAAISDRERLIEVDWGEDSKVHAVPIVLTAFERMGLIEDLVGMLRGLKVNVPKTKLVTADKMTTIYMLAEVVDLEQLNWLLTKLENVPNVIEVRRQRWN